MKRTRSPATNGKPRAGLARLRTGIAGLDEITLGGLPQGRTTLLCGGPGCGKTLFAMEFLVRGARDFGEPGVFMSFEETEQELTANVRSLGFDVEALAAQEKIAVDHVQVDRSELQEAGGYDLEGLFVRLEAAIRAVGAKRVVLDTLEALFGGFTEQAILRSELRRLFRWLKERGVTAVITAERGVNGLTRSGFEEYVSDCVILLDHRAHDQVSTRRIRVLKYRGTSHGTNEYPFLIDEDGILVLPSTSLATDQVVSRERVSTGVAELDAMLDRKGYFRGSSVLLSGPSGSGKTSFAAHFASAACGRNERCLYFGFEESTSQLVRNMRSIGIDLAPWIARGLLRHHASRPTLHGLEGHLALMHRQVRSFDPQVVIVDPISSFASTGLQADAEAMLLRLLDFLKSRGTTSLLLSLAPQTTPEETPAMRLSSVIDTWLVARDEEVEHERALSLLVVKSRGMKHSQRVRRFQITAQGIRIEPEPRAPRPRGSKA
jgi:circadian clock protein KaiC